MYINACATHCTSAYEIRSGLCIFKSPSVGLSHAAWDSLWAVTNGLWAQALLSPTVGAGPCTETQRGLPPASVGVCYSLSESPRQCLLFLELRGNFSCDVMSDVDGKNLFFTRSRSSRKFLKDFLQVP